MVANLKRERDLLYSEMLRKQTRVLPGVAETLQALHGRMRMAVVTVRSGNISTSCMARLV